jgi:transposase InsO family protein
MSPKLVSWPARLASCVSAKFLQNGAMTINMNDDNIVTLEQLKDFSKLNKGGAKFAAAGKAERNAWISKTMDKFGYFKLRKKEKTIVKNYIREYTGLSKAQLKRLIAQKRKTGVIIFDQSKRHRFAKKYEAKDISLLAKTDNLHNRMAGTATKTILERESKTFKKTEYENIAKISVSHLYNLRGRRQYQTDSLTVGKTNSVKVLIGQRMKPDNLGIPGFLRVDTVHQGDLEKEKGVYHINIVDEITQWEIVGSVQRISEFHLLPLLECMLECFPFAIINFHSDNGSEFINKQVAQMLNRMMIKQTKSRAYHHNDNGLPEGKNNFIIRKNIGYQFIGKEYAPAVNEFYQNFFNVYLNFHRPCAFPKIIVDAKGKQRKTYPQELYQTPYEKLKSLPNAKNYLKPGVTFEQLDKIAYAESDNDFAQKMQTAKDKLFENFKGQKLQFPRFFLEAREANLGLIS